MGINTNVVVLTGRMAVEPEIKEFGDNQLCTFCIVVNKYSKDKENNTMLVRCKAWNKLADIVMQYVNVGDLITISGNLDIRTYETKDKVKSSITEIKVDNLEMVQSKKSNEKNEKEEDLPF